MGLDGQLAGLGTSAPAGTAPASGMMIENTREKEPRRPDGSAVHQGEDAPAEVFALVPGVPGWGGGEFGAQLAG